MSMWDWITPRTLIDFQRSAAIEQMIQEAAGLYAEGYDTDADRVLDEMTERRRAWEQVERGD